MIEDPTKCEDTEFGNVTPVCSQVNQIYLDTKCLIDNKNTQVRVVRGAKKFKIDNDVNNTEKKGLFTDNCLE